MQNIFRFIIQPEVIRKYSLLIISLMIITSSKPIYAKDYKVEIIVFENFIEHQAYESYKQIKIEEIVTESEVWLIEPSMLLEEVVSFDESEDYLLLHHFSWGQESLDYKEAAVVNVIETDISGWIKVYANQLLYVNLDLDFNGYRLNEKRRIKLNEKHFFDHPKFGVLIQVSRLEEEDIGLN